MSNLGRGFIVYTKLAAFGIIIIWKSLIIMNYRHVIGIFVLGALSAVKAMPTSIAGYVFTKTMTFGSTSSYEKIWYGPDGTWLQLNSSFRGPSNAETNYVCKQGKYSATIDGSKITVVYYSTEGTSTETMTVLDDVRCVGWFGTFNTQFSYRAPVNDQSLVNLSTRVTLAPGGMAISGFVVPGTKNQTLLIRVIGKTLLAFGVPNAASEVSGTIYKGSEVLTNLVDNSKDEVMRSRAANMSKITGAFELSAMANDAVIVYDFTPGIYTVQSKAGSAGGEVLLEVYSIP